MAYWLLGSRLFCLLFAFVTLALERVDFGPSFFSIVMGRILGRLIDGIENSRRCFRSRNDVGLTRLYSSVLESICESVSGFAPLFDLAVLKFALIQILKIQDNSVHSPYGRSMCRDLR